jgi:hypothetical protein
VTTSSHGTLGRSESTVVRRSQALETASFGDSIGAPPPDLGPVVVELLIDPASGFLTSLETDTNAGTTPIYITLELTRLDPAPEISPPIR